MNYNRRKFIRTSASATGAGILSSMNALKVENKHQTTAKPGFKLLLLATDWGFHGNKDQFCAAIKKEGYDGAEIWWPGAENLKAQEELFTALRTYGLEVGFLYGAWQSHQQEHLETFKKELNAAAGNKYQRPLYINCHSGRDFFTYEQNKPFIDFTTARTKETGIPFYHETHRGRMMYAANITRHFIETIPELRLTFDVSHWCNVHESLLDDQQETVRLALERTDHIHARIGHAEGPQVNDPRAPEWEKTLKAHLAWWDKIVERKKLKGEVLTILTEFGPADYLPVLPYTRQPVANQWEINVHMLKLLRQRYGV